MLHGGYGYRQSAGVITLPITNAEGTRAMTPGGLRRSLRRLQRLSDQAVREAAKLGHQLGGFDIEEEWQAAVATCGNCRLIAAVDLTESPYLFGRALKRKCQ